MKKILPGFFVLLCELSIACSGIPKSFCYVHSFRPNNLVVEGTVISGGTNSIQLKVLNVLKGVETRSVITIWDGTDFNCNGNVSMQVASMASVGDTIIAVLPMIQTVQNAWDVVGDYSRPYWLFEEPVLKVKNDTVRGLISSGTNASVPHWAVWKLSYTAFQALWTARQVDCNMYVGISEYTEQTQTEIRQDGNKIHVFIPAGNSQNISVVSMEGKLIEEFNASGQFNFDLENYVAGIYIVRVLNQDGNQYRKKVIR